MVDLTVEVQEVFYMVKSESKRLKGMVKWFNDVKGYGFIKHSSGHDVFVHYSSIQSSGFKTLRQEEEVEFELLQGPNGMFAVEVTRLEKAANIGNDLSNLEGIEMAM